MRSQSSSWAIVRWSVSKPSRGRHAATRSASAAQVPASGRSDIRATSSPRGTITSRQARSSPGWPTIGPYGAESGPISGQGSHQVGGSPSAPSLRMGSPTTAYRSVTSVTSTRSMNCIERSHATRAGAVPGSTVIQVVSPSSTRCRACST